jgi:hypothetical protein
VIVEAIEKKHGKGYADGRSLLVVFDGDYSFEEDRIVHGWLAEIRRRTHRGAFGEILLVELARRKVFPVYGRGPARGSAGAGVCQPGLANPAAKGLLPRPRRGPG